MPGKPKGAYWTKMERLIDIWPQALGLIGIILTAASTIGAAIIAQRKSKEELSAIRTDTLSLLADRVKELNAELGRQQVERLEDVVRFERDIEELRTFYRNKLDESQAAQELALENLKSQYRAEIEQLRNYYESKIKRMEQGHKDRVESLKERIRALESGRSGESQKPV